jgi:hypothetical protein
VKREMRWSETSKGVTVHVAVDVTTFADGWTWGDAVLAASALMSIARRILLDEPMQPESDGREGES